MDDPAEITAGEDDAAEVALVEESTREAEQPASVASAAASEAAEESPEAGESAGVVAPVEDNAVADAPTSDVSTACHSFLGGSVVLGLPFRS